MKGPQKELMKDWMKFETYPLSIELENILDESLLVENPLETIDIVTVEEDSAAKDSDLESSIDEDEPIVMVKRKVLWWPGVQTGKDGDITSVTKGRPR